MALTPETIHKATGAPLKNIQLYWPLLKKALEDQGIGDVWHQIGALATIVTEVGSFTPINEYGGPKYFKRMYDIEGERPKVAKRLGNIHPGDGVKFHGRGFIQLTGRYNYTKYGKTLGIDLAEHPELALEPKNACAIFALFFKNSKAAQYSKIAFEEQHPEDKEKAYRQVRRRVNGGYNHYTKFRRAARRLEAEAVPPPPVGR